MEPFDVRDVRTVIPFEKIILEVIERLGVMVEGEALRLIETQEPVARGLWEPKKPSTMARKDYRGKWKLWVHTGRLRQLITHKVQKEGQEYIVLVGIFDHERAEKAAWLEFGTKVTVKSGTSMPYKREGMKARPLFRIVCGTNGDVIEKFLITELNKEIDKYLPR